MKKKEEEEAKSKIFFFYIRLRLIDIFLFAKGGQEKKFWFHLLELLVLWTGVDCATHNKIKSKMPEKKVLKVITIFLSFMAIFLILHHVTQVRNFREEEGSSTLFFSRGQNLKFAKETRKKFRKKKAPFWRNLGWKKNLHFLDPRTRTKLRRKKIKLGEAGRKKKLH